MAGEQVQFGPFVFDSRSGALLREGEPVAVNGRGAALLRALLDADSEVVSKAALMDAAWPDTTIEESNLTVQIAALRKSLGVMPSGQEWIATVPRVGYRLIRTMAPAAASAEPDEANVSVAVLPFTNMSSNPEQEFFASGIAEDLITDLSKVPGLTVIARNSSFAYSGKPADVRTVARDLGVRYIVEGSVRRAADRVRINAELIDARDNRHLWADRFDRDLADVFALQDEVVGRIVQALAGVLPQPHSYPARQRPTHVEAYDLFIRGRPLAITSPEGTRQARPLLEQVIALDPDFAEAHAWLAMTHHFGWKYWGEEADPHKALARASAERAVALDPGSADAHLVHAYVQAYDFRQSEAIASFERALRINPNHADAWTFYADIQVFEGEYERAVEYARRAFRLNPYPPGVYHWVMGFTLYAAGRYEEAVTALRHDTAPGTGARRLLAASLAQLGRVDEAKSEAAQFMKYNPSFSSKGWADTQPFRKKADLARFIEGYRKAGLPE